VINAERVSMQEVFENEQTLQNLINQCIIPLTLLMSKYVHQLSVRRLPHFRVLRCRLFLNSVYTIPQQMGAYTILLGTIIAIVPTFRKRCVCTPLFLPVSA
jgi:hypothetical protein